MQTDTAGHEVGSSKDSHVEKARGEFFRKFAQHVSTTMGSRWAFFVALLIVIVWAVTGPVFGYSNTWQLFINSFTTIATFLMVFVIQNTQNREAKATQIKLDELLRVIRNARNSLIDIEEATDDRLDTLGDEFKKIHHVAERQKLYDQTHPKRNSNHNPIPTHEESNSSQPAARTDRQHHADTSV